MSAQDVIFSQEDTLVITAVGQRASVRPSTISSSSLANPSVITTSAAHGLQTGDQVRIWGHSVAGVNGTWTVTKIAANTFSIPFNNATGGGATGAWEAVVASAGSTIVPNATFPFPVDTIYVSTGAQDIFIAKTLAGVGAAAIGVQGGATATTDARTYIPANSRVQLPWSGQDVYFINATAAQTPTIKVSGHALRG